MNECRHGRLARACEMCVLEEEVAELRAELEEARDRIAEINSLWADECAKSRHAETRAEVLRGEWEHERADAERYRWLCEASANWGVCDWDSDLGEWVRDSRARAVISAAIDAARGKQ